MIRSLAIAAAALLFAVVATANSAGYRYGASDQAFYIPAIAMAEQPSLFPRDRAIFAPQLRLWAGAPLFTGLNRLPGADLPLVFGIVYAITLAALFGAGVALGRALGLDRWGIAAFLVLLTLRHRIARTGANSLEGYMHPRMLAFALGVLALAWIVRRRFAGAALWLVAAAFVHPTTGAWFAVVAVVAALWPYRTRARMLGVLAAGLAVALVMLATLPRMDAAWLTGIGAKDYLFSHEWPPYAWALNLLYPIVLFTLYRRRVTRSEAVAGEGAFIAGVIALVAIFVVSVPLAAAHVAVVVQVQVNRIFWLLDAVVACYVGGWLAQDATGGLRPRARSAIMVILISLAVARGHYVLTREVHRPVVAAHLPTGQWMDAMTWLRAKPDAWYVVADPGHAWKYGTAVRVAALKDTLLEETKDAAFAIYDRDVALAVADRARALADFDTMTVGRLRDLRARFGVDVLVDARLRHFDLPVLYQNDEFAIYDLR